MHDRRNRAGPVIAALALACLCACSGDDDDDAGDSDVGGDAGADAAPDVDAALDPLAHLEPTEPAVLSPGNADGQDEDPSILRAADGSLVAAWYSNRNGQQKGGHQDREIFLARTEDGATWTDPPVQITRGEAYAFYPSLAQDQDGDFHLAWWRMLPTPEGCAPADCTGTDNRILIKSSSRADAWDLDEETEIAAGPGDWLPSLVADRVSPRRLVYFASPVRDADGNVDLTERVLRIYVVIEDGNGWSAPRRLAGVNPDESHNTYPHVVQTDGGGFLMTWTRYDAAAPNDVLHVIAEPSTQTMVAASEDGITWTEVATLSRAEPAVDVFPSLYADESGTWRAIWRSSAGGAPTGTTFERAVGGDIAERPELEGYTGRMLATATSDLYWGVWVAGDEGRQKIHHRFFAR
jgi:hypothetical protein